MLNAVSAMNLILEKSGSQDMKTMHYLKKWNAYRYKKSLLHQWKQEKNKEQTRSIWYDNIWEKLEENVN